MKKIILFLVLIFIASGVFLVFYVKQKISPYELEGPTQSDIVHGNLGVPVVYDHPELHYSLKYPSDWSGGTQETPPGIEQPHKDFQVFSRDFSMSDGEPRTLLKGSTILVRADKTDERSVDDLFKKQPFYLTAKEKNRLIIDHKKALRYKYVYEGKETIETMLIDNGISYVIRFRYASEEDRDARNSIYSRLLNSFKFPEQ